MLQIQTFLRMSERTYHSRVLRGPNMWRRLKAPDTRDNTMLAEASGTLQTKGFQEVEYTIAL
jgi:hypothetical protein